MHEKTHHMPHAVDAPCATCGTLLAPAMGRRRLLAFGAGLLAATVPGVVGAQQPTRGYEAMLLMCIDPRFVRLTNTYMDRRNLTDHYSQFALAGAAAGVVAPRFQNWHETFWDNLSSSIQLHSITAVIALNHRDCGAVKIAYGPNAIATPERETALHREILSKFRREAVRRHATLRVETLLMALDGTVLELT
jgi:carbonic anhydrase